jgi:hypothetical protein
MITTLAIVFAVVVMGMFLYGLRNIVNDTSGQNAVPVTRSEKTEPVIDINNIKKDDSLLRNSISVCICLCGVILLVGFVHLRH